VKTHIKTIIAKGKVDSSAYNQLIEDSVGDLYDMRLDIDELLATTKARYITSNINTITQNGMLNNINSLLTESLLKPRYSIIRPYITKGAPLIGGNSYDIISLSSSVFPDYGVITPPLLSTITKLPNPESAEYQLSYTDLSALVVGKPHLAVRNTGWIASMDESDRTDIVLTISIDQDSITNLSSNTIEVYPLMNSSISSISVITNDGTEQVIATNVNRNALLPFIEQEVSAVKMVFSADDYLAYNGTAYTGLKHFDLKKNIYGDTGVFQIDFANATSVVSVDTYLQGFDSNYELTEELSSTSENIAYEFVSNNIVLRFGVLDTETGVPRLIRYLKVKR